MIHEAYMPVYMGSRFSLHRTYGRAGPPEVVQEALADLKISLQFLWKKKWLMYLSPLTF